MRHTLLLGSIALSFAFTSGLSAQRTSRDPATARLVTEDIPRFWSAFDARTSVGLATALDSLYLRPGTPGLRDWTRLRLHDAVTLAKTVDAVPRYYASARASTLRAADAEPRIRASFAKLHDIYPDAVFPDVYFLVGRLTSGGTTSDAGLLIGMEMYGRTTDSALAGLNDWLKQVLRPVDDLPGVVAHELVHYQQKINGRSLLAQAVREGGADFVGELISGLNINAHVHTWVHAESGRERKLWLEFERVMNGTQDTGWFVSSNVKERPKDLGYFMGYRIAQAYYEKAVDKRVALRDILTTRNPTELLATSGYTGER